MSRYILILSSNRLGLGFRLQKTKKGGKHMFSFVVMSFVSKLKVMYEDFWKTELRLTVQRW